MPAPSTYTEERAARVADAISLGASREGAASCAGIAPSTLYEWIRRGKGGEAPYSELWERIEVGQRAFEVHALERIEAAARLPGNWTAAAWLLERRMPARYGRKLSLPEDKIAKLVEARINEMIEAARREREKRPAELPATTTEETAGE